MARYWPTSVAAPTLPTFTVVMAGGAAAAGVAGAAAAVGGALAAGWPAGAALPGLAAGALPLLVQATASALASTRAIATLDEPRPQARMLLLPHSSARFMALA